MSDPYTVFEECDKHVCPTEVRLLRTGCMVVADRLAPWEVEKEKAMAVAVLSPGMALRLAAALVQWAEKAINKE